MRDYDTGLSASALSGIVFGAIFRSATLLLTFGIAVAGGTLLRDALAGDLVVCSGFGGSIVDVTLFMAVIKLPAGIAYIFADVSLSITLLRRANVTRRLTIFFALVGLTTVATGAYFFAVRTPTPPRPCGAVSNLGA